MLLVQNVRSGKPPIAPIAHTQVVTFVNLIVKKDVYTA